MRDEEKPAQQEAEHQLRQRLYASTRTELLERQFSNSAAYDKAILTLSSAFLALSLTFIKDILPSGSLAHSWLLYASWALFAIAIVSTIASFQISNMAIDEKMERARRYYLEADDAAFAKSRGSKLVDYFNWGSGSAFIAGVVLTIAFVTVNFPEVQEMVANKQGGSGPTRIDEGHSVPTMQKVTVGPLTKGQPVPQMQQVPQTQPVGKQPATEQPVQINPTQGTTTSGTTPTAGQGP